MPGRAVTPDRYSYNAAISGSCWTKALLLLQEMGRHVRPDEAGFEDNPALLARLLVSAKGALLRGGTEFCGTQGEF